MKITKITYALLCAATLVGVAAPSVTTFASTNESISQTALTNNSDVKDSVLDDEALNAPEPEYISWNDLSTDHQAYFASKGFNSKDTFFRIQANQPVSQTLTPGAKSIDSLLDVNVVTLTGSTKKVDSTLAHAEYIISSGKPLSSLNIRLTMGSHHFDSAVSLNGAYVYSGGIYADYSGSKKYMACSLSAQYVSTLGPGTVSCRAGGVTLGS